MPQFIITMPKCHPYPCRGCVKKSDPETYGKCDVDIDTVLSRAVPITRNTQWTADALFKSYREADLYVRAKCNMNISKRGQWFVCEKRRRRRKK